MTSALTVHAAGLMATGVTATLVSRVLGAPGSFVIVAMLAFGVVALVSTGYLHGHPFERFGPANLVTTLRVTAVSIVVALLGVLTTPAAAWTAAIAGCTSTLLDGVDGWLARRTGMSSEFGARYDMEIDALLIMSLAALAWRHDKAGVWILLAGAMRYLFVAAGYAWTWMNTPLPASLRRKAVCVVQIVGLILAVTPLVPVPISTGIALITLLSLTWSFAVDTRWLWRHGE